MVEYPRLSAGTGNRPGAGIVHLGLGAFFRAHGAVYIAEAMEASGGDWGIIGVSLQRPNQRDLLEPQGYAYTTLEMTPDARVPTVRNVIQNVLVAPENSGAVVEAMSDPAIRIVTLTVTEKGYCHEPSTGRLNRDHPDIIADLADADNPRSSLGFLTRALDKRRAAGIAPFTILCCDNLPDNGKVVRGVVLELAALIDPDLADWIAQKAEFPCTMVDRIVPAVKDSDIEELAALTGVLDLSPVLHEPFRQWVVEDRFVNNDRPDFGKVGVQLVRNVAPFEDMKLRCLNGTHSALAYLGYLAGYETISETVTDPDFTAFVRHLWCAEILPGLEPPEGADLIAYTEDLLKRYQNPGLQHRTWQIAMDGSQKLPQRILGTIADNLTAGRKSKGLFLAVAAWMRYVSGIDEKGLDIDVRDPFSDTFKRLFEQSQKAGDYVDALLAMETIFPPELVATEPFRTAVKISYFELKALGAKAAVSGINND